MTACGLSLSQNAPLDLLGVGFGPANLALAIALQEKDLDETVRVAFIEQKTQFSWHPGMLIPGSRAQVSFLKDLVTLRNPKSEFSYLNWLESCGLLFEFITARDFTPFREEFDAYFRWAAGHFNHLVNYGTRVVAVRPAGPTAPRACIRGVEADVVDLATGELRTIFARSLVVASGGTPAVPKCVEGCRSPRVFHTSDYTEAIERGRAG